MKYFYSLFLLIVILVFLSACSTTSVIQRIDEDNLTITGSLPLFPSSFGDQENEVLNASFAEAKIGCGRYERQPELLSFKVLLGIYFRSFTVLYVCNP